MSSDPSLSSIARSLDRIAKTLAKIEKKLDPVFMDGMDTIAEESYCDEPHDYDSDPTDA